MSEVVPDVSYHQIQHFISESPWDANLLIEAVASKTSALFSKEDTVYLIVDESSHLKKGDKSVGVARQYSGRVGKTDNCQVAVYGALSAGNYYSLIGAKLFLPEDWTKDKERCDAAGVPDAHSTFRTKLELALEMVTEQKNKGIRFNWVIGDGFYGHGSQFRAGVDDMGIEYMLDIHSTDGFYLEQPTNIVPEREDNNGKSSTLKANIKPVNGRNYIKELVDNDWKTYNIRDRSKGSLIADIHVKEVFTWNETRAEFRKELLVISRLKKENKKKKGWEYEYKYSLSNAEINKYSWLELGQVQAQRYFVERSFQDAKKEIGMSEYQVRGWLAWHHHIALVMLGLLFVLTEKISFREEYPLLTAADIRQIIVEKYARNKDIFDIIHKRHKRRYDDIVRCRKSYDNLP